MLAGDIVILKLNYMEGFTCKLTHVAEGTRLPFLTMQAFP